MSLSVSRNSGTVSTLAIPSRSKRALYNSSEPVNELVWLRAIFAEAFVFPDLIVMIGIFIISALLAAISNDLMSEIPSMWRPIALTLESSNIA